VETEKKESSEDIVVCDWCREAAASGAYFVPGKGVLNLCGRCRMVLKAVLVDTARRRVDWIR